MQRFDLYCFCSFDNALSVLNAAAETAATWSSCHSGKMTRFVCTVCWSDLIKLAGNVNNGPKTVDSISGMFHIPEMESTVLLTFDLPKIKRPRSKAKALIKPAYVIKPCIYIYTHTIFYICKSHSMWGNELLGKGLPSAIVVLSVFQYYCRPLYFYML